MTLDETIRLASDLAEKGDLDGAIAALTPLVAQAPGHPVPLQMLGIFHARLGRRDLGAQYLTQAVNAHCCWETASPLLMVLWDSNRWEDIARFGEAAKAMFPDNALFLNVWGAALSNLGRAAEGLPHLERALALAPNETAILRNLANALVRLGRGEEAVASFSRSVIRWSGDTPAAGHSRAAYAGLSVDYDANQLHRSFTQRLSDLLRCHLPLGPLRRVLELGCGTGLLAGHLPPGVERLVGIDLSPEMLAQARARGGYHHLVEGDLVAVMAGLTEEFDAIASACVLYHIADLRPVFAEAARLLAPGGIFVFSTDPLEDGSDIGITAPGEFCHSRAYLRRLAQAAGLREIAMEIDVHRGPPGFWCAFRQPSLAVKAGAH